MGEFKLGSQIIEFDEMFERLNQYKRPFIELAIEIRKILREEVNKLLEEESEIF